MSPRSLLALIAPLTPVDRHNPWPRFVCNETHWIEARDLLKSGAVSLLGLWGERGAVHAALMDAATHDIAVLSLDCPEEAFPSLGAAHPPALRLERTIADLFGLIPVGLPDPRPWLDHGCWGVTAPLVAARPARSLSAYAFLPVDGESLHQIPVGPVHAGVIEPGHFRFTANGETIVRLEARLGYTHKGVDNLMQGAQITRAAQIAARVSGDSTVAYGWAFARAVEAALGVEAPPRAVYLRALMCELERLANHFGDVGAICNDAAFVLMHAHCGVLREQVLRASDACFGHRLMRDRIVPGGVDGDVVDGGARIARELRQWRKKFAALAALYEETNSLEDRTVGAGVLKPALAQQFAAGGFVGRASGRKFDARKAMTYAPYDKLQFEVPCLEQGDVDARVRIRILEIEQSVGLIEQILGALPKGPLAVELPDTAGEGMSVVEGFRGDILAWVRLDESRRVARCCLRDPSWFQWPLLEGAIEGNIVGDFPLCNKSFNCSYSGSDL